MWSLTSTRKPVWQIFKRQDIKEEYIQTILDKKKLNTSGGGGEKWLCDYKSKFGLEIACFQSRSISCFKITWVHNRVLWSLQESQNRDSVNIFKLLHKLGGIAQAISHINSEIRIPRPNVNFQLCNFTPNINYRETVREEGCISIWCVQASKWLVVWEIKCWSKMVFDLIQ